MIDETRQIVFFFLFFLFLERDLLANKMRHLHSIYLVEQVSELYSPGLPFLAADLAHTPVDEAVKHIVPCRFTVGHAIAKVLAEFTVRALFALLLAVAEMEHVG